MGYIVIFIIGLIVLASPHRGLAGEFQFIDLWLTPDQQGRYHFERGEHEEAGELFEDLMWKGVAQYRAAEYEKAAQYFAQLNTAQGQYNLGNSLAQMSNYEAAAKAYERALDRQPDFADATFNLQLMQALLESIKKEEDQDEGEAGEPSFDPDELKFDERGKQGKEGQIEQAELSEEQLAEMLLRQVQTSPAEFLQMKFDIQWKSQNKEDDPE